jgi:hypothetical protein
LWFRNLESTENLRCGVQIHPRLVSEQFIPGLVNVPIGKAYGSLREASLSLLRFADELLSLALLKLIPERGRRAEPRYLV